MPGAPLLPMLATAGSLPLGPAWSYEFKWDGVRMLASFDGGPPRLWARSGAAVTLAYPEIAALSLPPDSLLDGEMVVLNSLGRPSFTSLAERMHVRDTSKAARLAVTLPVTYMIFDVLRLGGRSLLDVPYVQRRALLEELDLGVGRWTVPPVFPDGVATEAAARENSLEGVVAKRLDSVYAPGARTPDWVKVKFDRTGDFVIGGWRAGARKLGGLLVGQPGEDGRLRFRGRVGGGIGAEAERNLLSALTPLVTRESPFMPGVVPREDARGAHWVSPDLVVEVRYGNKTPDGRLRFRVSCGCARTSRPRSAWRRTRMAPKRFAVQIDGRDLELSNLDKVMYPAAGFTKGEVIDYYTRVAPALLPHLKDRALTRIRFPNGVDGAHFFEKNAPAGTPSWVRLENLPVPGSTKSRETIDFVVVDELATLVWTANLASLELHTPQWRVGKPPDLLVVDLDPGAPAGLRSAVRWRC